MNKKEFIVKLMDSTCYDEEKCKKISIIIEKHFIVGKRNKEKIINDFIEEIDVDSETASDIYNKCVSILSSELKNKLKHPFKSKD